MQTRTIPSGSQELGVLEAPVPTGDEYANTDCRFEWVTNSVDHAGEIDDVKTLHKGFRSGDLSPLPDSLLKVDAIPICKEIDGLIRTHRSIDIDDSLRLRMTYRSGTARAISRTSIFFAKAFKQLGMSTIPVLPSHPHFDAFSWQEYERGDTSAADRYLFSKGAPGSIVGLGPVRAIHFDSNLETSSDGSESISDLLLEVVKLRTTSAVLGRISALTVPTFKQLDEGALHCVPIEALHYQPGHFVDLANPGVYMSADIAMG